VEHRIKIRLLFCFVLFLIFLGFSSTSYGQAFGRRDYGFIDGPTLLYPTAGNIDLTGKENLEFRWETSDVAGTDYFDFKLYKGSGTSESDIVFQQKFSTEEYPVKIPASLFEVGQEYTWYLRQVFTSGQKSEVSYSSFTIKKK